MSQVAQLLFALVALRFAAVAVADEESAVAFNFGLGQAGGASQGL